MRAMKCFTSCCIYCYCIWISTNINIRWTSIHINWNIHWEVTSMCFTWYTCTKIICCYHQCIINNRCNSMCVCWLYCYIISYLILGCKCGTCSCYITLTTCYGYCTSQRYSLSSTIIRYYYPIFLLCFI